MKALIVGAGIAGLASAQRLQSHGWEVLIVEHARGPRGQGYMLDFFGPGYDAAKAMGVLPRLKEVAYGRRASRVCGSKRPPPRALGLRSVRAHCQRSSAQPLAAGPRDSATRRSERPRRTAVRLQCF